MIRILQVHKFPLHILQGSPWKHEVNSAVIKTRFYQLSAENDMKCDGMCVFHILSLQTTSVHVARCFIPLERRNVPLSFGIKHDLFGLASL